MARRRVVLGAVVALAAIVATATPSAADATTLLAQWEMDEAPGATTMVDSSGNGFDGAVGDLVLTGKNFAGSTGYRWTYTKPNTPPAQPGRLVQVPRSELDPGTRDFAVTLRYRTTHKFGNIIQKGQSGVRGGYWKIQAPQGQISCLFRGGTGQQAAVRSDRYLNDGQWHTVRCERTTSGVTMTIDGVFEKRRNGPTGSIANRFPLTVGGKLECDQVDVTCDYFVGEIDSVRLEVG